MMRCCKHCGALLEDDAKVCNFCSTASEVPRATESAPKKAAKEADIKISKPSSKKRISKKALLIAGIALAVVIVAAIVITCIRYPAPLPAVEWYEAVRNGDCAQLKELAPMEFWERMTVRYDSVDQYLAAQTQYIELRHEIAASSVSVEVVDQEIVNKEDITEITDRLEEFYKISPNRVKSAQQLILKVVQQHKDYTDTSAILITALQIDSEWYLWSNSGGTFLIHYMISDMYLD